ncbi:hypothetical protein Sta7437_2122 [Stanieria cyanosphaera PCC 7437]|uniref:Uncharacterized protein n=1 Tax=Stanieria cyanosphaera (strain ATCC 29371 / PCC 7437) TaxID=111780 RepID=K9XVH4_STAC7|nr:hypothetical protein [Stanieria cyanosphaera]AFZ35672.1 hypothetical protein Sta7437_2122 [Stanieria cyanosphaera PCC 7437]
MIELLYLASQIQCGANSPLINVKVDVYHNQALVKTMSLNEKSYFPVNSLNDLTFQYRFVNSSCTPATPTQVVLAPQDALPALPAAYDQQSIQQLLNGLNSYEELFLVELGTTNTTSSAYDLQDVVFIVNNNPILPD